MTSIRRRLTLFLALGLVVLLAIGGAAVYELVRTRVHAAFDADLEARARSIGASLVIDIDPARRHEATQLALEALPGGPEARRDAARTRLIALAEKAFHVELALDPAQLPDYQPGPDASFYAVRVGADEIARSPSLAAAVAEESWHTANGDVVLPDTRAGRGAEVVVDVPFRDARWNETWSSITAGQGPSFEARVTVARAVDQRDRFLRTLRDGLVLSGALLVLAVALVTWLVVRRGLAPLEALTQAVSGLDAHSLDRRLPTAGLPDELRPVALRLNEALDRIEASVARERQTAANIAHELRTPLAELTTITELAVRWPDDAEIAAQAVKDSHAVAEHMGRVVSALLKVARADAGQGTLTAVPLDLGRIVDDAWSGVAASADEKQQVLEQDIPQHLTGRADGEVTEAVVASLFKNAVQHAPARSTIRCAGRSGDGISTLTVENPAPELTAEDVEHVRSLFWRKDAARTPSRHTGLGLSVVAALAASAAMELSPSLESGVFRMTLRFPSE